MTRSRAVVAAAWLAMATTALALAAPGVDRPGLYYDEAFLGQQAKDFFEPDRDVRHPASTRQIEIAGRPFPLRNAVYLGSLKSQLLIPAFALFEPDVRTLRLSTLTVAWLALLTWMLWAGRVLGPVPAVLGGALAGADPAFAFLAVREWGPFTALLLCRGLALWLLTEGWLRRSPARMLLGGLAVGLGVTTRADFAVVVAGAGLALWIVRPATLREALGSHRALAVSAALAAVVGAGPMLLTAGDVLQTSGSGAMGARGGLDVKLGVLASLLDGSHFHRLMEVGGDFDRTFEVEAPPGAFGAVALLAAGALAAVAWRRRRRPGPAAVGDGFCLLAWIAITAGTLALPGAVRAHHLWNGFPLLHLAVAGVAARAWRAGPPGLVRGLVRTVVVVLLATVAVGDLAATWRTRALLDETGGRGRWSDATRAVAAELEADPSARGVSLDWGFHEPLLFETRRARLVEPIWEIAASARRDGRWRFEGGPGDVYLVHDGDLDLFGYGPAFLAAARRAARRDSDAVDIRTHRDRQGAPVFWSVRLARPHELGWRQGVFSIRWRDAPGEASPG